jgi:hypothetical protein
MKTTGISSQVTRSSHALHVLACCFAYTLAPNRGEHHQGDAVGDCACFLCHRLARSTSAMRTPSEQVLVTRTSLCLQTSSGFVGHHQCKTGQHHQGNAAAWAAWRVLRPPERLVQTGCMVSGSRHVLQVAHIFCHVLVCNAVKAPCEHQQGNAASPTMHDRRAVSFTHLRDGVDRLHGVRVTRQRNLQERKHDSTQACVSGWRGAGDKEQATGKRRQASEATLGSSPLRAGHDTCTRGAPDLYSAVCGHVKRFFVLPLRAGHSTCRARCVGMSRCFLFCY